MNIVTHRISDDRYKAYDSNVADDPPYYIEHGQTPEEAILNLIARYASDIYCHPGCRQPFRARPQRPGNVDLFRPAPGFMIKTNLWKFFDQEAKKQNLSFRDLIRKILIEWAQQKGFRE